MITLTPLTRRIDSMRGVSAVIVILLLLFCGGCKRPVTIKGHVSLPTNSVIDSANVLVVAEGQVEQFVQDYNRTRGTSIYSLVYAQNPTNSETTVKSLFGLSGGNDTLSKMARGNKSTNAPVFIFSSTDSAGRFRLELPNRGSWCFFITANNSKEVFYWFKKTRISFGEKVEIDAGDSEFKTAVLKLERGLTLQVQRENLIKDTLEKEYGLVNPDLSDSMTSTRASLYGLLRTPKVRALNPLATMLWIAIGLGYLFHAHSQKNVVSFVGALLIFVATFVAPSWVWVSICCLTVMVLVFIFTKKCY